MTEQKQAIEIGVDLGNAEKTAQQPYKVTPEQMLKSAMKMVVKEALAEYFSEVGGIDNLIQGALKNMDPDCMWELVEDNVKDAAKEAAEEAAEDIKDTIKSDLEDEMKDMMHDVAKECFEDEQGGMTREVIDAIIQKLKQR